MEISQIAFSKFIGIKKKKEEILKLDISPEVINHIGTIHASAQFTLAETQSGLYLSLKFPQYKGKFIPLLRSSSVKYKKPAKTEIVAYASATQQSLEKFEQQFIKKGRAIISVNVEIHDINNNITMVGVFTWFVEKI